MNATKQGVLHIVATPIGNLEDISFRAVRTLASADVIAAEDTRRSRKLLEAHGISGTLISLHEHNEDQAASGILERLGKGEAVALISDAGTPLVSDPGFRLVRRVIQAGGEVVTVPGPSAVIAALTVAGLPTDRFVYEGFLPSRPAARLAHLGSLGAETRTIVFFESSHRIQGSITDMAQVFGAGRQAAICRELTKQFETVLRAPLGELEEQLAADSNQRRGEFVVVVAGASEAAGEGMADALELARQLREHLSASKAAQVAARIHSVSRRELYEALNQSPGT